MECRIRRWRIEDANDIAETLNNKKVLDNLRDGIPFPYTAEDAKEFIQAMNVADPETTFSFAITVDDKAIGSIAAFRQSNIHSKTAEVGYYIAEPYWGKDLERVPSDRYVSISFAIPISSGSLRSLSHIISALVVSLRKAAFSWRER